MMPACCQLQALAAAAAPSAPSIPDNVWALLLTVAAFLSVYCLFRIHFRFRVWPWRHRLFWSVVVLVPFLGPLLYGALFQIFPATAWTDGNASGWGILVDRRHDDWGGGGSDGGGGGDGGGCGGGGD